MLGNGLAQDSKPEVKKPCPFGGEKVLKHRHCGKQMPKLGEIKKRNMKGKKFNFGPKRPVMGGKKTQFGQRPQKNVKPLTMGGKFEIKAKRPVMTMKPSHNWGKDQLNTHHMGMRWAMEGKQCFRGAPRHMGFRAHRKGMRLHGFKH